MTLEIRSARSLDRGERAELFTAAYEGYILPLRVDEPALASIEDAFDLDVEASRIAFRDGVPVGLANLGVRGDDAWVGGVGVVPPARRSGIGEALMLALHEEARNRAVRRVWLEVIVENTGAFALYDKLGYRVVREVEVWSLSADGEADGLCRDVPAEEAQRRIRQLRTGREPWQRADETLAHYPDLQGLVLATGAVVYRRSGAGVQLLQLAGETEPLLRALRALGTVGVLNLPGDDPSAATLRAFGATVVVRQHEMLLEYGPGGAH